MTTEILFPCPRCDGVGEHVCERCRRLILQVARHCSNAHDAVEHGCSGPLKLLGVVTPAVALVA